MVLRKEPETARAASCENVVRDMINLNIEQQQEIATLVFNQPSAMSTEVWLFAEQWEVFDATIRRMAADGTLPNDFRYAMAPVYTLSQEAGGIMASEGWKNALRRWEIREEFATAMAATLPLAMSGTKELKASTTQVVTKNVNPGSLISRQNSNEMSGSQVKRIAKDMKANGYKVDKPVDVVL